LRAAVLNSRVGFSLRGTFSPAAAGQETPRRSGTEDPAQAKAYPTKTRVFAPRRFDKSQDLKIETQRKLHLAREPRGRILAEARIDLPALRIEPGRSVEGAELRVVE